MDKTVDNDADPNMRQILTNVLPKWKELDVNTNVEQCLPTN